MKTKKKINNRIVGNVINLAILQEFEHELREMYWKGFEDGKRNSLKHNLILIKSQLKEK